LHNFDHFIARFVDADNTEVNLSSGKFLHLILDLESVRRTPRMIIMTIPYVLTVTRSVTDQEQLFGRVVRPLHFQSLVKTALHIFRSISSALSILLCYKLSACVQIFGKFKNLKPWLVLYIAVSNKADPHFQSSIVFLHIFDDSFECLFGSLNPGAHRSCLIEQQTNFECLCLSGFLASSSAALFLFGFWFIAFSVYFLDNGCLLHSFSNGYFLCVGSF